MKLVQKKQKGQGIVEYAGAIVVAAALIAAALAFAPEAISGMFNTIITAITNFLEGSVPAAAA